MSGAAEGRPFNRIVVLTGMPRSGTSWLSQILDSSPDVRFRLSPIFSWAFKNAVDESSGREAYDRVFEGAYASDDEFMNQTARRAAGEYPTFARKAERPGTLVIKQTRFHNLLERMLELYEELRVVVIVRHPCGAIHSWLTTPREFPAGADPAAEWRTGACRKTGFGEFWGFDDWKAVTTLHLRLAERYPRRVLIVRYEDLVTDPEGTTDRIFSFVGLPVSKQTVEFLATSQGRHHDHPHAVFKRPAVKDRWRSELDAAIARTIVAEVRGTELERFLG